MKMITPANGVVIDVPEASVEHFKAHGYKPVKTSGKTKADLVEKVEKTLTNKEMEQAIADGEKSPQKPRPRKKG